MAFRETLYALWHSVGPIVAILLGGLLLGGLLLGVLGVVADGLAIRAGVPPVVAIAARSSSPASPSSARCRSGATDGRADASCPTTAGPGATSLFPAPAAESTMQESVSLGTTQEACIDACDAVVRVTERCVDACSREADRGACIRTCRDAADLAALLSRLVARESPQAATVATACADACEAAAGACREHEDDQHCWACVEPLEECADACRELAG